MRNKYISKQSNEILTFFNEQDRHCFDYELAKKALPKSNDSALRELLRPYEEDAQVGQGEDTDLEQAVQPLG